MIYSIGCGLKSLHIRFIFIFFKKKGSVAFSYVSFFMNGSLLCFLLGMACFGYRSFGYSSYFCPEC